MFICKECLEKHFTNIWFGLVTSYGPCEVCEKTRVCDDQPMSLTGVHAPMLRVSGHKSR